MASWTNDDGLKVKLGVTEATPTKTGSYGGVAAPYNCVEADLDLADLAATATSLDDTVKFPTGAVIEKVELVVLEIADGASATLDIGLMQLDGTEENYDGLVDGATEAALDDTEGATYEYYAGSSSVAGGAAGTVIGDFNGVSEPCTLSAMYVTAAFTAGRVKIRVFYTNPLA